MLNPLALAPICLVNQAKKAFDDVGIPVEVMNLDNMEDGPAIQVDHLTQILFTCLPNQTRRCRTGPCFVL